MRRVLLYLRRHPRLALAAGGAFVLIALIWLSRPSPPRPKAPGAPEAPARLLTPDVELRGIVRQLQEDNAALRKALEDMVKEIKALKEKPLSLAAPPKDFEAFRREIPGPPSPPPAKAPPAPVSPLPPVAVEQAVPRISVLTITPVVAPVPPPAPAPRWVHLPAGSFVEVTLLSGVYAPVRSTQPLPVLIHLDEMPRGPNAARVPLASCAAIARALGDYTSRRAMLQLDTLSCVLPSGQALSRPLSGWVSGADGVFGLEGTLVEQTGPYLARVALAGFLQGAAAAFAQAQTTTTTTTTGQKETTVTGDLALYGASAGLAQTASRMAAFYERQLEGLVPAIYVPAGVKGAAVVQAGVTLDGMPVQTATEGSAWRALD